MVFSHLGAGSGMSAFTAYREQTPTYSLGELLGEAEKVHATLIATQVRLTLERLKAFSSFAAVCRPIYKKFDDPILDVVRF